VRGCWDGPLPAVSVGSQRFRADRILDAICLLCRIHCTARDLGPARAVPPRRPGSLRGDRPWYDNREPAGGVRCTTNQPSLSLTTFSRCPTENPTNWSMDGSWRKTWAPSLTESPCGLAGGSIGTAMCTRWDSRSGLRPAFVVFQADRDSCGNRTCPWFFGRDSRKVPRKVTS